MLAVLLGVQLAFASLSIVGKVTMAVVPPMALVLVRLAGGALVFGTVARVHRISWFPPRGMRLQVGFLALLGLVVNQAFFAAGLRATSAIEATVLVATIPLFTATYAVVSRRERGRPTLWAGLLVALAGVILVVRPDRIDVRGDHVRGDLFVVLNALSYAIYLVHARPVLARHGAVPMLGWMFPIGALAFVPVGLPSLLATVPSYGFRTWCALAFIVLFPTAFAYGGNAWALARVPSSVVAVFVYLQPALAVALALAIGDPLAVWLHVAPPHESLALTTALGMLATLGGVALATRR